MYEIIVAAIGAIWGRKPPEPRPVAEASAETGHGASRLSDKKGGGKAPVYPDKEWFEAANAAARAGFPK